MQGEREREAVPCHQKGEEGPEMISQNNGKFRIETQKYACYGFSLLWWAWYKNNLVLSHDMIDHKLYYLWQKKEWMTETWWIKNPVAIAQWLGLDVTQVTKESPTFRPRKTDIIIGQWKADSFSHFVPMSHERAVRYDPWFSPEGGSSAVRRGKLMSYRILR